MANENDQRRGGGGGQTAVDKLQEYSEQASETYQQGRDQLNHFVEDLRQRATNEPLKTVLMATGVGIVLGILFG